MGFRTSAPAPNSGYNRTTDWPTRGGVAASAQASANGVSARGGVAAMFSVKTPTATPGSPGAWHPTVAWMFGFVVVELVLFGMLSRYLNL